MKQVLSIPTPLVCTTYMIVHVGAWSSRPRAKTGMYNDLDSASSRVAALHDPEHSASEEELPFPGVGGAGGGPSSSSARQSLEGLQEQRRACEEEVSPNI